MAGSVNKVLLIGHLGKDPEIRTTQTGLSIANFSIATSESWKDKVTGERKENTQWHRVVIFNDALVGVAERFLKKGSKVYLEGQLETRKWTDSQGKDNYTTEVVLRPFKGELTLLDKIESGNYPPPHDGERQERTSSHRGASGTFGNSAEDMHYDEGDGYIDDEIPF